MESSIELLTPLNDQQWKGDMEIHVRAKGLYRVVMDIEEEPNHVVDKARLFNKMDEAFWFLCLSISEDLLFHLMGLKTLKEIWDQLASLYDKHDDLRIYQPENELISLH